MGVAHVANQIQAGVDLQEIMQNANVAEVLRNLDADLIGLAPVKQRIKEIAAFLVVSRARLQLGIESAQPNLHMCFTGNPGTGKTTVALRMAEMLHHLGYVRKGHVLSVTRDDLVGQYIGHTAPKTKELVKKAMGGVLFIDEAYSLNSEGRDFGQEAVATLVQMMETYRNEFAVFFAGYSREMDEFISMNPGLASRISGYLDFEMYTNDELWKVLNRMAIMKSYMIAEDARAVADIWFDKERTKIEFGNARSARRLLDEMVARHARRIHQMDHCTEDDLVLLLAEDAVNSDSTNGSGVIR